MSLPEWPTGSTDPKPPCQTDRESWSCPNMKEVEGDLDMYYEHYECKVCGRTHKLDYEDMK
jgi:hypothetical protein